MKYCFILFFICVSTISHSQKLQKTFDKFDSVYTISTREEVISGKILSGNLMTGHVDFIWQKKSEFFDKPSARYFEILLSFNITGSTIIDESTEIKIQFADNSFGTYKHAVKNSQIATEGGVVLFKVPKDDKLFTTDIKTIRISTSDSNTDYDLPTKKASIFKTALNAVKIESEKS